MSPQIKRFHHSDDWETHRKATFDDFQGFLSKRSTLGYSWDPVEANGCAHERVCQAMLGELGLNQQLRHSVRDSQRTVEQLADSLHWRRESPNPPNREACPEAILHVPCLPGDRIPHASKGKLSTGDRARGPIGAVLMSSWLWDPAIIAHSTRWTGSGLVA